MIGVDEMDGRTKQSIMTSRSFPAMITDFNELMPHVANYASRCALKLRKQNSVCSMITVFLQSNFFREDLPQYSNSASFIFTTPTNSTIEIVSASEKILHKVFKPGIHYKRGGVIVSDISPSNAIQPDLFDFDPIVNKKHRAICKTIDEINSRIGMDSIILASQSYCGGAMKFSNAIKRSLLSPDYSTSFEAFVVK